MRRIVVTRFHEEAAYSVVNRKLLVKTSHGTEAHEYTDRNEWMEMIRTTFGITSETLVQALRFLEDRGIRLF